MIEKIHLIEDYWFEKLEISDLCDVNFSFYPSSGSLRKKLENSIMFIDEYFFTCAKVGFSITTDQRTQLLEQKNFKLEKVSSVRFHLDIKNFENFKGFFSAGHGESLEFNYENIIFKLSREAVNIIIQKIESEQ